MNTINTASNAFSRASSEAGPALRQASDDLLQGAGDAIDSTRNYANHALDKAEGKIHDLRSTIDPVVEMLTSKAQHLARQSLDMANEAKARAQHSLNQAAGATTRYVVEQPVRSILIAAAVGAAVALLISATVPSSEDRNRNRY